MQLEQLYLPLSGPVIIITLYFLRRTSTGEGRTRLVPHRSLQPHHIHGKPSLLPPLIHKQVKIQNLGKSLAVFKRLEVRYPVDDEEQKCDGFPKQKDEGTFQKPHSFHASQRVKL